jgi:site-specific recombinase XerC
VTHHFVSHENHRFPSSGSPLAASTWLVTDASPSVLGHESDETTQIYLHADMQLKERALGRADPRGAAPTRFRPKDRLLAFLESL